MKTMFKKSVSDSFWAVIIGLVVLCFWLGGCGIEPPKMRPKLQLEVLEDKGLYGKKIGVIFPEDQNEVPTMVVVTSGIKNSFTTRETFIDGERMVLGEFNDFDAPPLPENANIQIKVNAKWADGPTTYGSYVPPVENHFNQIFAFHWEGKCGDVQNFEAVKFSFVREGDVRSPLIRITNLNNGISREVTVRHQNILGRYKFEYDSGKVVCEINH